MGWHLDALQVKNQLVVDVLRLQLGLKVELRQNALDLLRDLLKLKFYFLMLKQRQFTLVKVRLLLSLVHVCKV